VQQSALRTTGPSARIGCEGRTAATLIPSLLLTATAAALLSGCASSDQITTSVAAANGSGSVTSPALAGDLLSAPTSSNVDISPNQHGYLDALTAAGVHRSSDLRALSIGSYVCQARAAGQSAQAVWDFVLPLVRGDIQDDVADHDAGRHASGTRQATAVSTVTAEYIRIATERLC
jgi:Protein of unknown function (DUF732)